ncbi:MAG: hypothetical protein KF851_08540 [Pirellulaceae bacterium]|nr:hypothetical protein [Pirellulaceae bacterium]
MDRLSYPQADSLGFVPRLRASEFHWFFVQGVRAVQNGLFIPGASSLLNGIEASLRFTVAQISNGGRSEEPSAHKVFSNNLINDAFHLGLPIQSLAFPNENDFETKLATKKPNRVDVEIVRQRNNICHGNIWEYVNEELGSENRFFTPDCLAGLADTLIQVTNNWAESLGQFRTKRGL